MMNINDFKAKYSFSEGVLVSVQSMTPEVNVIEIHLQTKFSYIPGQFADLIVLELQTFFEGDRSGIETTSGDPYEKLDPKKIIAGGLTFVPSENSNCVSFCAKISSDPTIKYLRDSNNIGKTVLVRARGSLIYSPDIDDSTLFIAGGMGITPIISIVSEAWKNGKNPLIIYSCKTKDHLLFPEQLEDHRAQFILSREEDRRIDKSYLTSYLSSINKQVKIVYICGPPSLVSDVSGILRSMEITEIRVEKWC